MKIVPFNLELAKKLKYPSRIETQNGGDIKILTFDSGAKYEPIVAVLNDEFIMTYYENGVSCVGGNKLVLILKGEDEQKIMTQEEKQLLLRDLCARLPYGVKGRVYAESTNGEYDIDGDLIFFDLPFDVTLDEINTSTEELHVVAIGNEDMVDFIEEQQTCGSTYTIDEFKPYLRPMSSMTEKERDEYTDIKKGECNGCVLTGKGDPDTEFLLVDWLNEHHFDYRGLIEKGLALESHEDMYKI